MFKNCVKKHPIVFEIIVLFIIMAVGIAFYSPYERILGAIESQNYDKAINISTVGSKLYPSPNWYSLRGYARFQIQDYDGAIKDYDKAYMLESDDYKIMNFDNKIYIKFYLKDYNSALDDFDSEIRNAKDDFIRDSFLWDKAQFLYNIGEYEKALNIYDELLVKSDNDKIYLLKARLYFERAQVYKKLDKDDLAQKDIDEARSMSMEDDTLENPIPVPNLLLDTEM